MADELSTPAGTLRKGTALSTLAAIGIVTSNLTTAQSAMDYQERQEAVEKTRRMLEGRQGVSADALREAIKEKPEELRRDLYALYWALGTETPPKLPPTVVTEAILLELPGETAANRAQMSKWLLDFESPAFGDRARIHIGVLPWRDEDGQNLIRLIGVTGVAEGMKRVRAMLAANPIPAKIEPRFYHSQTWAGMLALARQGDAPALQQVLEVVRGEEHLVTLGTILLPDLAYTRAPKAFDLLRTYLASDARLPQVKDTAPGRLVAVLAAELLAKHLVNFPLPGTNFSERQIGELRRWADTQKEWQIVK